MEVSSPFISRDLEVGNYDVIIRAYDLAGNYVEAKEKLRVISPLLTFTDQGRLLLFGSINLAPWTAVIFFLIILGLLLPLVWLVRKKHQELTDSRENKDLPQEVKMKLAELKRLKKHYGIKSGLLSLFLFLSLSFWGGFCQAEELTEAVNQPTKEVAESRREPVDEEVETTLSTPAISSLSENISNEEIFYIGGEVENAQAEVVVYLQKKGEGGTMSFLVVPDKRKNWFYRHTSFLSAGEYVLWTQARLKEQLSPPSAQVSIRVEETAIQMGGTRLTREAILWLMIGGLGVLILALAVYLLVKIMGIRKHRAALAKEIREAEEAVSRGLAFLKKDIEKELEILRRASSDKGFSREKAEMEKKLLEDIEKIKKHIGKEMEDVEKLENILAG